MAVLRDGRWIGRPKAGEAAAGGTLESLIVRLRDGLKINEASGCWEWTGATNPETGYGLIRVGKKHLLLIHRVMLELVRGKPLGRLCSLHTCDNPPCGNPEHLFAGTKADNNRDADQKGRSNHWGRQRPCPS